MHLTPLHNYFIFNGELRDTSVFETSGYSGGVYEVLRVDEGIPLFLEEHLDRFYISAVIAGKTLRFRRADIVSFLRILIQKNGIKEGNILISCKTDLKAFFIPHDYPETGAYETGVRCGVLYAERITPNAKVLETSVRQQANRLMADEGYYEVLLVDHAGRITEGSRSNVFFIQGDCLVTPPGHEVLLGITRQKTIQLARNLGIPFREAEVKLEELNGFQAAFLTGTSPKILPLFQIGDRRLNPQNPLMQQLRVEYDELIRAYIRANR